MRKSTIYASALGVAAGVVAFTWSANYLLPRQETKPPPQVAEEMHRLPRGHFCIIDECQSRLACIDMKCQYDPGQHVPNT